jgi:hypothetical protein
MAASVVAAIDGIFAGPRRGSQANDPFVAGFWRGLRRSPERAKAIAIVQTRVAEAHHLLDLPDDQAPLRTAAVRERVRELLACDLNALSIDSAWELANQLKRELLVLGDTPYVWAHLEYEAQRDRSRDKWHRWSDHFSRKRLQALIDAGANGDVDRSTQLEAVRSLRKLYELRAEAGLDRRARAAQKCRYLTLLIPILLTLLAALSGAIDEASGGAVWKEITLAASAGALGAALSGIFRVRDRLIELDDLRSFWPAMRIQPLIGATAGLVTLLILEGGAVKLDGTNTSPWAAIALLTFVAGFSEPFFLGLVQRVAVIPDKEATKVSAGRAPAVRA